MTNRTVQFWGQGYSTPPAEGVALTPCTITATIGGNVVFSGTIPTIESSDIDRRPGDQTILFTCEIPLVVGGNVGYTLPASFDITGNDVFLEQVEANYSQITNPIYTPEQVALLISTTTPQSEKIAIWEPVANPPLSSEDIAILNQGDYATTEPILAAHNLLISVSSGPTGFSSIFNGDPRSNVVVTNATYYNPPPDPRPESVSGTWGWEIETASGQTSNMTFDLNITPGIE